MIFVFICREEFCPNQQEKQGGRISKRDQSRKFYFLQKLMWHNIMSIPYWMKQFFLFSRRAINFINWSFIPTTLHETFISEVLLHFKHQWRKGEKVATKHNQILELWTSCFNWQVYVCLFPNGFQITSLVTIEDYFLFHNCFVQILFDLQYNPTLSSPVELFCLWPFNFYSIRGFLGIS